MGQLIDSLNLVLGSDKKLTLVATPNPELIVQAQKDASFAKDLTQFDWLLPDGMWLVWASRILAVFGKSQPLTERLAGVDVVAQILQLAWQKNQKVLLIGGRNYRLPGHQLGDQQFELVPVEPISVHHQTDPKAPTATNTLYWWSPAGESDGLKQNSNPADLESVLIQVQPDIVFVALGAPRQESFLITHRRLLSAHQVKLGMSVGGSFDVLLGRLSRAPIWMQNWGLEWLYRLMQEPWRWRRQLRFVKFAGLVLRQILT